MRRPAASIAGAALVLACCLLVAGKAAADDAAATEPPTVIHDDSEPIHSTSDPKPRRLQQDSYYFEGFALLCLAIYALNMIVGRINNDRIVKAWLERFALPADSLMGTQFAIHDGG
jgi:hypothetical protein